MMENLRNHVDMKLVCRWRCSLVATPSYASHKIFSNDLAGIHVYKTPLLLEKPIYTGMTILENSKILM